MMYPGSNSPLRWLFAWLLPFVGLISIAGIGLAQFPGSTSASLRLPVLQLQVLEGQGEPLPDAFRLSALSAQGRAVLVWGQPVVTSGFSHFEVKLSSWEQGLSISLIWADPDMPGGTKVLALPTPNESGVTRLALAKAGWTQRQHRIGLLVNGSPGATRVQIDAAVLSSATRKQRARDLLATWTAFAPWDQTSINLQRGYRGPGPGPVPIAAWWLAANLSLLLLWRLVAGWPPRAALLLALLMPWLVLDLQWQSKLNWQLDRTNETFAGKSQEARHLADVDGVLYAYAQRLKREVLVDPTARVQILQKGFGHDYTRLRLQFHLLPYNIYNIGRWPVTDALRRGDIVIRLSGHDGVAFEQGSGRLRWPGSDVLIVEPLLRHPIADVYRVKSKG